MNISQLVPTPEGLRAVYVIRIASEDGEHASHQIIERRVDAVGLLELEAQDIRAAGPHERKGAQRGRKTKVVGIIMEGMLEPQPAPTATAWFERLYGDSFAGAVMLGYTRSDDTIEEIMEAVERDAKAGVEFPDGAETQTMRHTRRYWAKAYREAVEKLSGA